MVRLRIPPDAQVTLALFQHVPERSSSELSPIEGATVDPVILPIDFDSNASKHIILVKLYFDVNVVGRVFVLDPKVRRSDKTTAS